MSRKVALRNIIYYFLYLLVIAPLVSVLTFRITGNDNITFTATVICSVLALVLISFNSKKYLIKCFKNFKVSYIVYPIVGYIIYYFTVTIVLTIIEMISSSTAPVSENQEAIQTMVSEYNLILMFIMLVIVAPIMEELVFRAGIIYAIQGNNHKRKKHLIFLSYFASIALFSMIHVTSEITGNMDLKTLLVVALPYIMLACVFLYNFTKTKYNVLTSILCHMLNNMIAYLVLVYFLI